MNRAIRPILMFLCACILICACIGGSAADVAAENAPREVTQEARTARSNIYINFFAML